MAEQDEKGRGFRVGNTDDNARGRNLGGAGKGYKPPRSTTVQKLKDEAAKRDEK